MILETKTKGGTISVYLNGDFIFDCSIETDYDDIVSRALDRAFLMGQVFMKLKITERLEEMTNDKT